MKVSPRVRWAIHLALAALGLAGIGLLVRHAGIPALVSTLREAGPLLPVALALEGGRVAADTWRTSLLYARAGVHVPFRRLFSLQLSSYPLNLLIPAGGAASEAFKAAALSEEVGGALGAAVATTNQALVLFGGFIVSIPCTAVALSVWGPRSGFTIAIATQALTALGLGAFIQLASRRRLVGELVRRVSGRAGDAMGSYRDAVVVLTSLPLDALGAAALGKALQLGVLGVLAWAAGAAPRLRDTLLVGGVHLLGAAAGDMVPGQIGATDATFAIAAEPLGIDLAHALAIPLMMHAVQLTWAVVGASMPIGVRRTGGSDR